MLDVINCTQTAAGMEQVLSKLLDAICQGNGRVSIFKGLGMYSLLLISVILVVAF